MGNEAVAWLPTSVCNGKPDSTHRCSMIDAECFWSHVALLDDSEDTCWIWVGAMRDDGRGRLWREGRDMRAHHAGWEIRHGRSLPKNSRLKQECGHPQCVRHWRLAGQARKLSRAAVREIVASPLGARALARKYGVTHWAVLYHRSRAQRTDSPMNTLQGRV